MIAKENTCLLLIGFVTVCLMFIAPCAIVADTYVEQTPYEKTRNDVQPVPSTDYNDTEGDDQCDWSWSRQEDDSGAAATALAQNTGTNETRTVDLTVSGSKTRTWKWNGCTGSAPGCTFKVNWAGTGHANATGGVSAVTGGTSSCTATATGKATGNGSGLTEVKAELNAVQGQATVTVPGQASHTFSGSVTTQPYGITITWPGESGDASSFAKQTNWSVSITDMEGGTAGEQFSVTTTYTVSATATDSVAGENDGVARASASP